MPFKETSIRNLPDNLFTRIGTDWMLVTAGTVADCNTMTASWGQTGILWNREVATVYVRPQRYTRQFVEREPRYSLSFFAPGERRRELELLGSKSGRDGNKIAEAGLRVAGFGPHDVPAFEEAALVLVCRKLYQQDMAEDCFLEQQLAGANYPGKDFHRMYVGEIELAYVRE